MKVFTVNRVRPPLHRLMASRVTSVQLVPIVLQDPLITYTVRTEPTRTILELLTATTAHQGK